MKILYNISLFFLLFAFAQEGFSQEPPQRRTRQRPSETVSENTPTLTERAKIKNEEESKAPAHIVWLREVYRDINLEKENNAALLYPAQPIGNRVNLFTLIFRLVADGKVPAYNYMGEREVFTDDHKINFEEVLKKYGIIYTAQGTGDNVKYTVEDRDIPGAEVTIYMIKEGWYFDAATGNFKSQIIALCPLLIREDYELGGTTKNPLFWVLYENLRPYLSRELIMTSNYNNALSYTMDDYFTKKMYSGEIVKATNLMNKSLAQQVGNDPEMLKKAQDSIETQLKNFNKNLWVHSDTIPVVNEDDAKNKSKEKSSKKTSDRGAQAKKDEKPKTSSSSGSSSKSSSPTRSVRRR
ncbi:MAG: gliding motility protein GldN [Dysgonamonadaceae bacterium]|jgi:gliding motility associated protien GldN|nr:gliding motility protein GldN [Dysgonamonadaceae bacterium]